MKTEYIFTNLDEIALCNENISNVFEENKWKAIDYEAGEHRGKMLVAPDSIYPKSITMQLGLSGIYRIYICMPKLRSENYLYVKLNNDICFTGFRPTRFSPVAWGSEEYFEEVYWKTADLTDTNIIIGKPYSSFKSVTAIAWIKCIPVDSSELIDNVSNKCLQCHFDKDELGEDTFECDEDYLIKFQSLKNTNTKFLSFEFSFDYDKIPYSNRTILLERYKKWEKENYDFISLKEKCYKAFVDFSHKMNIEIFAANRMQISDFILPYDLDGWNIKFVKENKKFHLVNRNGRKTKICSYAFSEVQDYVIERFVEMLRYGFDGITLILHRGVCIGFEEPVLKRFKELYGDLNPLLLPMNDNRLNGVWCEFMNKFMYKLRKSLNENSDRYIKINVITDYSLQTAKNIGFDLEYWSQNKLVDIVSQGDMEMYEDLTDCMDLSNPHYIDIKRYNNELRRRPIIKRNYATNIEKVCKHIPEFISLKEKYGTEVYNVIPWVHTIKSEEYDAVIEKMKRSGATNFLCFNTNHLVWDLPEWYNVSHINNNKKTNLSLRRFYRVLSIDGCDMSQFNPNWRG